MQLELSPHIERDLDEIADWIAQDNLRRAVSFIQKIREGVLRIGEAPLLYQLRPEIGEDARIAMVGHYVILFRIAGGTPSPGDKLPGIRTLAEALVINPNTVIKVYRELENEGVLDIRHGLGAVRNYPAPQFIQACNQGYGTFSIGAVSDYLSGRGHRRRLYLAFSPTRFEMGTPGCTFRGGVRTSFGAGLGCRGSLRVLLR